MKAKVSIKPSYGKMVCTIGEVRIFKHKIVIKRSDGIKDMALLKYVDLITIIPSL